jgi:hypothetical protein
LRQFGYPCGPEIPDFRKLPERLRMQDLNPLFNKLTDLKGRADALRGYL